MERKYFEPSYFKIVPINGVTFDALYELIPSELCMNIDNNEEIVISADQFETYYNKLILEGYKLHEQFEVKELISISQLFSELDFKLDPPDPDTAKLLDEEYRGSAIGEIQEESFKLDLEDLSSLAIHKLEKNYCGCSIALFNEEEVPIYIIIYKWNGPTESHSIYTWHYENLLQD